VDPVRARFSATAPQLAARAEREVEPVREEVLRLVALRGDERALDVGTGAGVLALALAPLVRTVVGIDIVPELLEAARRRAPENVTFVEGDASSLPFDDGYFDLGATRRTLHHMRRPELAVAELTRVTKPGGRILVDDQIAPADPLAALDLDRFERVRDPSHTRTLSDADLRGLFDANSLVLEHSERATHRRELGPYLELAGCTGEEAEQARELSPGGPEAYTAETAWFVLRRPAGSS
jgi:SAM-dependent methyltransferase